MDKIGLQRQPGIATVSRNLISDTKFCIKQSDFGIWGIELGEIKYAQSF